MGELGAEAKRKSKTKRKRRMLALGTKATGGFVCCIGGDCS